MSVQAKIITVSLASDLVKAIDEAAMTNFTSRSGFIRESLVLRLNHKRIIDEVIKPSDDEFLKQLNQRYEHAKINKFQ